MFKKNGWKEPIRPLSIRGYSPLHMSARTLLTRWNFHCYGAVVVQKDITRHPSSLCSQNCAKEKLKVGERDVMSDKFLRVKSQDPQSNKLRKSPTEEKRCRKSVAPFSLMGTFDVESCSFSQQTHQHQVESLVLNITNDSTLRCGMWHP